VKTLGEFLEELSEAGLDLSSDSPDMARGLYIKDFDRPSVWHPEGMRVDSDGDVVIYGVLPDDA
jgi:hypothetical protein